MMAVEQAEVQSPAETIRELRALRLALAGRAELAELHALVEDALIAAIQRHRREGQAS